MIDILGLGGKVLRVGRKQHTISISVYDLLIDGLHATDMCFGNVLHFRKGGKGIYILFADTAPS